MNLLAIRRYAIRKGVRVRFTLDEAGECMVDEHGVVKIPSLREVARFNVEALLASVEQFSVDTAEEPPKRQKLSREQLEALLGAAAPKAEAAEE